MLLDGSQLQPPVPARAFPRRRLKPNTVQPGVLAHRFNDTQSSTPEFIRARKTCFCLTD
jgi:hypothetical protein